MNQLLTNALGWVFASGRRTLLTGIALLALVLIAISRLGGTAPESAPARSAESAPAPSSSTSALPSPKSSAGGPDRAGALAAARDYLAAFFAPQRYPSEQSWHDATDTLSTRTLAALNAEVPRRVVPRATARGLAIEGIKSSYAEASATLSDGTKLHLALVRDAGRWLVDECAPASDAELAREKGSRA